MTWPCSSLLRSPISLYFLASCTSNPTTRNCGYVSQETQHKNSRVKLLLQFSLLKQATAVGSASSKPVLFFQPDASPMNQFSRCCHRSTTSSAQTAADTDGAAFTLVSCGKCSVLLECLLHWCGDLTPSLHFTLRHYNHPLLQTQQTLDWYSCSTVCFFLSPIWAGFVFLCSESCRCKEKLKPLCSGVLPFGNTCSIIRVLLCFPADSSLHHPHPPHNIAISIQATLMSLTHTLTHAESNTSLCEITARHP